MQGAARSFAFASGMAALSAALRLAGAGDHVVAGDDLYGGTSRLLARIAPGLGIDVTHVDTADVECVCCFPALGFWLLICCSALLRHAVMHVEHRSIPSQPLLNFDCDLQHAAIHCSRMRLSMWSTSLTFLQHQHACHCFSSTIASSPK